MGKRSITDDEIALIRALAAKGIRNRDIQFYFNRPDRPVNSGRITQIKQGTYGPEAGVASDEKVDAFLDSFNTSVLETPSSINIAPHVEVVSEPDRLLMSLVRKGDDGQILLDLDEGLDIEFKSEFSKQTHSRWVRAVAAFANARGGRILFGVADDGHLDIEKSAEFLKTDISIICDQIRKYLTPTPEVEKGSLSMYGNLIGYLEVKPAQVPPVIVQRDGEKLHEGSILYRYPGSSENIKAGDLLTLLQDRDRRAQQHLLELTNRITEIGSQNAMLVDTQQGTLDGRNRTYRIEPKLAEKLSFIHEGAFEEVSGAPTLKLIGDVSVEGQETEIEVAKNLTANTVLNAFLARESISNPLEYIMASLHTPRHWLPIFYFAKLAQITPKEMLQNIEGQQATYQTAKQRLKSRVQGTLSAYQKCSGRPLEIQLKIIEGEFPQLTDYEGDDNSIAIAISSLPEGAVVSGEIFNTLQELAVRNQNQPSRLSSVFRAACRVDELLYR